MNATSGFAIKKRKRSNSRKCQSQGLTVTSDLATWSVDLEVAVDEDPWVWRGCLARATEHGTDAQHEFTRAERLGHVVVGTEFETNHAVGFRT